MNSKIQDALNEHLNAELYSSYLYLSMVNYFAAENLEGMAHWMQIQTDEEHAHAMKFIAFINQRGGRVALKQIDEPKFEWSSPLEAFQDAYEHECLISSKIDKLMDLTTAENDRAATTFLQWFVTEQVEEESNALSIVDKLKMVGDNTMGLMMMDQQLAQRTSGVAAV